MFFFSYKLSFWLIALAELRFSQELFYVAKKRTLYVIQYVLKSNWNESSDFFSVFDVKESFDGSSKNCFFWRFANFQESFSSQKKKSQTWDVYWNTLCNSRLQRAVLVHILKELSSDCKPSFLQLIGCLSTNSLKKAVKQKRVEF